MRKEYLEAGEIVSTHGVRGEVKVNPWADSPAFLTAFGEIYLDGAPVRVESARVQKNCALLKLEGVDSVEQAARLRGKTVFIRRDDAPIEEGRVFVSELIGLPVYAGGEEIGTLREVLTLPANDVYVVRGAHEYLIPAVSAFLERVDPEQGIWVRLIEGMRSDED